MSRWTVDPSEVQETESVEQKPEQWVAEVAKSSSRAVANCYGVARVSAGLALGVGLGVLVGGVLELAPLQRLWPGGPILKLPTALGLLLMAGVLEVLRRVRPENPNPPGLGWARWGVAGLLLLGGAAFGGSLGGSVTRLGSGVLWEAWGSREAGPVTLQEWGAATAFLLWGAAAGCLTLAGSRWVLVGQVLAHGAGLVGYASLVGFLYGGEELVARLPWPVMPAPLAALFLVLTLGLLCTHPQEGLMRLLTAGSTGGQALRRLLPALVIVPVLVGAGLFWVQDLGWLPPQSGAILSVVLVVVFLGLLVWHLTKELHGQDLERQRAWTGLSLQAEALNQTGDCVFITDHRGVIQWANTALLQCSGYALEEIRGQTPRVFKSGRHGPEFYAHLWGTIQAGQIWRGMVINRDKHGRLYHLEETITPFSLGANGITHFIAILRDLTERNRLEAERHRWLRYLESSVNEIYVFDAETLRFEYVNEAAVKHLGYTAEQLRAMTPLDLKPEFTLETFRQRVAPLVDGQKRLVRFETVHRRADGSLYPVEVHLQHFREGERAVFLAVILDITERREAERQRRLVEAELQRAQAVAHVGSWTLDLPANRLHWSAETHRIFGTTPNEVVRVEDFFARVHEADRAGVMRAWQAALRGAPYRIEHRIRAGDQIKWVEERAELEFDAAGNPVLAVGTVHDITERRALEEQFRQAQKLEAVGQLAGGVAHDFNNLLAIVMLRCALAESHPMSPEVREALQDIRQVAERAADLVKQLLLFSRRQVMQPQHLELNQLILDLVKMLQRVLVETITLKVDLAPTALRLYADKGMLEQVLLNLVVNARDAMPAGGELLIATAPVECSDAMPLPHPEARPGRFVRLSVHDRGEGIPPDILPRIFEPFFTTKGPGKGTGLGLATVLGIVKQHQGWIQVTSEVGRGTRFDLYLPWAEDAASDPDAGQTAAPPTGGAETLLVVEDEPTLRRLLTLTLARAGYRVLEAGNAEEAVALVESHPGAVALMLTDLVLPGHLGGRDLARQLRLNRPELRVIFMSGYDPAAAGAPPASAGEFFLPKPCPPHRLLAMVRRCLDRPPQT